MSSDVVTLAKNIKLLLLDVDGVLTDGRLYFDNQGGESKTFNTLDGHGIKMLQANGVRVGIITGRQSTLVEKRAKDLGIDLIKQGREDKYVAMQELIEEHSSLKDLKLNEIAYMGDDYPDLAVMCRIGLSVSVPDAASAVKERSVYITHARGGEGAVRELCDLIMRAQGSFDKELEKWLPNISKADS